jgi:hypothetical protein
LRKHKATTEQEVKFEIASAKFFKKKILPVNNMKTILRQISKKKGETSLIKKKKKDLLEQLERRKHRMEKYRPLQLFDAAMVVEKSANSDNNEIIDNNVTTRNTNSDVLAFS